MTAAKVAAPRLLVAEPVAADMLGMSRGYLRQSRMHGSKIDAPPYVKLGRAVRYDVRDIERFIEVHRVQAGE